MIHQHDFPGIGHNGGGCRLCDCTDRDGLIDYLAEQLWESRRSGHLDDRPWTEAGAHWQHIFRGMAPDAIEALSAK